MCPVQGCSKGFMFFMMAVICMKFDNVEFGALVMFSCLSASPCRTVRLSWLVLRTECMCTCFWGRTQLCGDNTLLRCQLWTGL
jgi:hypothetical protein